MLGHTLYRPQSLSRRGPRWSARRGRSSPAKAPRSRMQTCRRLSSGWAHQARRESWRSPMLYSLRLARVRIYVRAESDELKADDTCYSSSRRRRCRVECATAEWADWCDWNVGLSYQASLTGIFCRARILIYFLPLLSDSGEVCLARTSPNIAMRH